jgi:hypothetical protein
MDPRVVAVLRLFAEKESTDGHAEVTDLRPEEGVVELRHGDVRARLQFDEAEMLVFLRSAGDSAEEVWGRPLSAEESAARFMTIHLDESLATREPHETGWWTYRGGGFDPIPPWEAHARRHQEP